MKNWIKVIFALNSKLDAMTYSIDGQVDSLSSLFNVPTMELYDNIIKLNDKKVRIINLRVLHDKMKEALSEREYYIMTCIARGATFEEIAGRIGLTKGGTYRIYRQIIIKLSKILVAHGYTIDKFAADYGDIALVSRTYKKLAGLKEAS